MEPQAKSKARAAPERPSARGQLLDAAGALMGERQTIDVPLAEIAARAEVNVALVSYYFGGKEGLLLALAKRDAATALDELDPMGRPAAGGSPGANCRRHPHHARYPSSTGCSASDARCPAAAREIAEFSSPPTLTAKELMEEGAKDGTIRPLDPTLFYLAALGACEHIFANPTVLKYAHGIDKLDDETRRRYTETVLDTLMNGYLAK